MVIVRLFELPQICADVCAHVGAWCVFESLHVFEATEVKVRLLFRLMVIVCDRSWLSCSSGVMVRIRVWFWVEVTLKLRFSSSLGFYQSTYK